MTTNPTGYRTTCDEPGGCERKIEAASPYGEHGLNAQAQRFGWQIQVKLDGDRAKQGGGDYCPAHRKVRRNKR